MEWYSSDNHKSISPMWSFKVRSLLFSAGCSNTEKKQAYKYSYTVLTICLYTFIVFIIFLPPLLTKCCGDHIIMRFASSIVLRSWHSFGVFLSYASSDWLSSAMHQHRPVGLRSPFIFSKQPVISITAISWFTALNNQLEHTQTSHKPQFKALCFFGKLSPGVSGYI